MDGGAGSEPNRQNKYMLFSLLKQNNYNLFSIMYLV